MSANTIITSVVTGGTNNHTTVAEEANTIATDFVTQGVVGAITVGSGSTAGTGSFAVTQDATPDMGVTVLSGQAYITATPSSQDSQVLRARASANYTSYTINANASGSTKYDWIYLSVSATNANAPSAAADNVTSIYTSRSSSNTTDNGTPPTYGLLLAIVTVANGASSITNSNITDKRFNTSIGAQNGSLIVTQQSTGLDAIIQAAGQDANININLKPKGTGLINLMAGLGGTGLASAVQSFTNTGTGGGIFYYIDMGGLKILTGETVSETSAPTLVYPSGLFTTWASATYSLATVSTAPTGAIFWTNGSDATNEIVLNVAGQPSGLSFSVSFMVIGV